MQDATARRSSTPSCCTWPSRAHCIGCMCYGPASRAHSSRHRPDPDTVVFAADVQDGQHDRRRLGGPLGRMYNHAPADYVCPMCAFVSGHPEPGWSTHEDIVLEDDQVLALISSRWWPRNLGHVILVPKQR